MVFGALHELEIVHADLQMAAVEPDPKPQTSLLNPVKIQTLTVWNDPNRVELLNPVKIQTLTVWNAA